MIALLSVVAQVFVAGCGSDGEGFAGTWTAVEGYGGLVIEQSGDEYSVVLVDGQGNESVAQKTTLTEGSLRFSLLRGELPLPQGADLIAVAAKLVVSGDPATDRITLTVETSGGTESVDLRRAAKIALSTSSETSTSPADFTQPPTPQALVDGDFASKDDEQVALNTYALQCAIEWFIMEYGVLPEERQVSLVGPVSAYIEPWPANPYKGGGSMLAGDGPGEFTYTVDGDRYTLTGHLGSGEEFTVRGGL